MIHYHLRCSQQHMFDEWFSNGAECDTKMAESTLKCPTCGDTQVTKAIMAPNVGGAPASEPMHPSCGMGGGCGGGMCGF